MICTQAGGWRVDRGTLGTRGHPSVMQYDGVSSSETVEWRCPSDWMMVPVGKEKA